MEQALDVRGTVIDIGDLVCAIEARSSTLYVGTVSKITAQKVFIVSEDSGWENPRDHYRVVVLEKHK